MPTTTSRYSLNKALVGDPVDENSWGYYLNDNADIIDAALPPFSDATALVQGSSDSTKKVRLDVDGLTTATTRVLSVPDADTTIVGTDVTQTLTNKIIASSSLTDSTTAFADNSDSTKKFAFECSNISTASTIMATVPNISGLLGIIASSSVSSNGYIKLASNSSGGQLVLQWGINNTTSSNKTITYPTAFANATLAVFITPIDQNPTFYINGTPSAASFNVIFSINSKNYWFAIGY
jgi:hypothetical protein